ncbi:hypothetical protein DP114_09660 [Brasilonema sennae CENA114]|jgi:hypothetical protein|uniref:Uncharacterized protein n=3 Tax=Scytonemataceae TaxID=1182 RepID=A0A856MEP0_9CYAN|nr:hypothetical protein [Brasilonema octagenarum UFV-OR1]QDL08131.1 hypothetical protein DP114_09660 [Brasilonema sennae CENA114]
MKQMTLKSLATELIVLTNKFKEILMAISDDVQPGSERPDNLRDELFYYLLNKVKHSEQGQDVTYFAEDFEGKSVSKPELIEHLEHLIREGAIEGKVESDGSSGLVTCKNARITTEGENLARVNFFKV